MRRWRHRRRPGRVGVPAPDPEALMSTEPVALEDVLVTERELWQDGPPHELFMRLRAECPIHWTERLSEYPEEAGFWSVTRADDVHEVSRDWQTYSSATGVTAITNAIMPVDL